MDRPAATEQRGSIMISTTRSRLMASTLLAATAAFASPAFAQTTPTGAAQESATTNQLDDAPAADEVVVTGSRIARPNIEGNSPVSVVSKQDVELRAPSSAEQLLRDLPGSAAGIGTQVNNGQGGTATFNLRGLGSNRNLVLLNSRRVTSSTLGQHGRSQHHPDRADRARRSVHRRRIERLRCRRGFGRGELHHPQGLLGFRTQLRCTASPTRVTAAASAPI